MIDVNVILKPHGIDSLAEQIAEMTIVNDMTHEDRPEYGNYRIKIDDKDFRVTDHKRSDGIWPLVGKAIQEWQNSSD